MIFSLSVWRSVLCGPKVSVLTGVRVKHIHAHCDQYVKLFDIGYLVVDRAETEDWKF